MEKEVTLKNLNRAFMKELFSSHTFWFGFILYTVGLIMLIYNMLIGGFIMLVSSLIMINADWQGRKLVVKRLRWIR